MLEGMTLVFDPQVAGDLDATLRFDVTGPEPGRYYLRIANGDCTFHVGSGNGVSASSLTITTPPDVWLKVSRGELNSQEALMQGLYQADGDFSLLLRMNTLFKSTDGLTYTALPDQRPAGPIALSGMAWMTVAFIPWTIFWIAFALPSASLWVSIGLPLFLSLAIVAYRLRYDKPTWLETGSLAFFALAGLLVSVQFPSFDQWGSVMGSVAIGMLWFGSILLSKMPLSGEYSKWGYIRRLWRTGLFIYPNAVISLMWGWQFLVAALIGAVAVWVPAIRLPATIVRYLLLVPAFAFTSVRERGATNHPVANVEKAMARVRWWAGAGLATAVIMLATFAW
jgi:hypothetical protein